ncbi:MAG TPA: ricin-type beta-trefoil lectin domain protein [Candidatus Nanopelagicales bacterium]|nr:ricin-type beta-trefoil lectin domain protein [Candidatus Nanopelagicales bacterium]
MKTCKMLVMVLGGLALLPLVGCASTGAPATGAQQGAPADELDPLNVTNVRIRNIATDWCVARGGFGAIVATACDIGDATQRWDISVPFSSNPNDHKIVPKDVPLQCLDTASAGPGGNVQLNPCVASPFDPRAQAQLWQFLTADAQFRIRNTATGTTLCLQVPAREGARVELQECKPALLAQEWQVM